MLLKMYKKPKKILSASINNLLGVVVVEVVVVVVVEVVVVEVDVVAASTNWC